METSISIGARTYLTGLPTPRENRVQAWIGVSRSNARVTLRRCVSRTHSGYVHQFLKNLTFGLSKHSDPF